MRSLSPKEHALDLYEAILHLKTKEDCFDFFQDLCSPSEMYSMEQRFDVASLLLDGAVYVDISQKTNASSATISRVKRVLTDGTASLRHILEETKDLDANEPI
ncbi:MAG: YerC/YecD family TrpR-related protein [Oscillospiraceae bacterium]|nr:YerC/YecD family TrpR-related protein [Oscillospiraceae bacterium]